MSIISGLTKVKARITKAQLKQLCDLKFRATQNILKKKINLPDVKMRVLSPSSEIKKVS